MACCNLFAPGCPGGENFGVRERREEGGEGVVCCYAGCVEVGDGGEEGCVVEGVVEAGWGEGGHSG